MAAIEDMLLVGKGVNWLDLISDSGPASLAPEMA